MEEIPTTTWVHEVLRQILFLPPEASSVAGAFDSLHFFIIITTFVVAACIFFAIFVFIIRYRHKPGQYTTPNVASPFYVEFLFYFVPLSVFLVWFFIGFRQFVWAYTSPPGAMIVYVTAKQWMWKFTYPDGPESIGVLRIPAHRPVRLLLTSRDVIHSFFVPAFRLKKDAVPGRYTDLWFKAVQTGTFVLQCAEYCGLEHSMMLGSVIAMEPTDFDAWMSEQKRTMADASPEETGPTADGASGLSGLAERGLRIATEKKCLNCHSIDGTSMIGPTWLDLYGRREPLQSGQIVDADDAYLTESMMEPGVKIVAGFEDIMPTYQGQIEPLHVAAILEYIRSLRTPGPNRVQSEPPNYVPAPSR